jgi:hypothetical protein
MLVVPCAERVLGEVERTLLGLLAISHHRIFCHHAERLLIFEGHRSTREARVVFVDDLEVALATFGATRVRLEICCANSDF